MDEWKSNRSSLIKQIHLLADSDLGFSITDWTIARLIEENTFKHQRHHVDGIRRWLASQPALDSSEELSGLEAKIAMSARESDSPMSMIALAETIPTPPFCGSEVVSDISLDEIYSFINEAALFRGQWQVRKGKMTDVAYQQLLDEKILPEFQHLKQQV